ncbi:SH3 domain-containing protein [Clostridium rectalis]|uniref:C40 family peptidase n=1 Tax=Clostridium rectalis TaxID=2040295 RepID=UPI000F62E67D|nr:SH3 domain-containing protein [Clostridium rectalis]
MIKSKLVGILTLVFTAVIFTNVRGAANDKNSFKTNVPKLDEKMLNSYFWIEKINKKNKTIMSKEEIVKYNREIEAKSDVLVDLKSYKESLSKEERKRLILNLSTPSKYPRYDKEGNLVSQKYYDNLIENLNLDELKDEVKVGYGITVRRTIMKTFPTFDMLFTKGDNYEFDRLMETAVYPIEPVVILSSSKDKKWYFAQIYNYLAWIPAEDVAVTSKEQLFKYLETKNFLVVSGSKIYTVYNGLNKNTSELQIDMGVKIPLASEEEFGDEIYGQDITGNYVVNLPTRKEDGTLEIKLALIRRNSDVSVGYLPYTRENIINQSFKFLGERYGWGGMFNARDCSAFVMDVYRSMGVNLPRNTGEQSEKFIGKYFDISNNVDKKEREKIFNNLKPGTALYMDGHVMLYIGKCKGEHYMIHDFSGFYNKDKNGEVKYYKARQVMVTPICLNIDDKGGTYKDQLYGAIEFTLGE